jgi:hypothetical protein
MCSFLGRRKNSPSDAYLGRAVSTSVRLIDGKCRLRFGNFDAENSQRQLPGWSADAFHAIHTAEFHYILDAQKEKSSQRRYFAN